MRISDWSSDVCSSDLEAAITPVALMELRALPDQPTRRFEQRHLIGGDETRVGGRQAMLVDDRLYARDPRRRQRRIAQQQARAGPGGEGHRALELGVLGAARTTPHLRPAVRETKFATA